MHYDIGTLSLWIGVGVALIVGGIQAAGWRHRALIIGLIVLGGVCIVAALAAPPLTNSLPSLANFMTLAAVSPSSWFALFMFVAALVLFSKPKQTLREPGTIHSPIHVGIPDISTPELGRDLRAENEALEARLKRQIEDGVAHVTDKLFDYMHTNEELNKATQAVTIQLALDQKKLSDSVEAERAKTQGDWDERFAKIIRETQGYARPMQVSDLDLKHLLYFAILLASEQLIMHLLEIAPKREFPVIIDVQLNDADCKANAVFLEKVSRAFSHTNRWSDYRNLMANGEADSDQRLSQVPIDRWQTNVNPVEIRRYSIAAHQSLLMTEYLEGQLQKLREDIYQYRPTLVERANDREKS